MWMRSALLVVGLAIASAAAASSRIAVEHDPATDFARYTTYAWKQGAPARRLETQKNIETTVDQRLLDLGWVRVSHSADAWVSTYLLVDRHTLAELANPTTWEFYTGSMSVDAYDVGAGTLVVDIVDAATERVVWRGLVSGSVTGTAVRNQRKLDKALRKMFKRFPD
jgi:hypothetical protein